MKRAFTWLCCWMLPVAGAVAQSFSFVYDGNPRPYIVHLPAGYNSANLHPVVLNFHGVTQSGSYQQGYADMDAVADTAGFIAVYPTGVNNTWNVGFNNDYSTGVNDVGFVNALIDTLAANYSIDVNRVYACGLSNGGYFSYRLACELEERIAAIASVAGVMADSTLAYCVLQRHTPVMHIHGTSDFVVAYNNPLVGTPVEEGIAYWVQQHICSSPPDTTPVPNTNTADNCTASFIDYNNCADGSRVLLCKITGGGHTWPGATNDVVIAGNTNRDFHGSAEIWRFFRQFSLQNPPVGVGEIEWMQPAAVVLPNPFNTQFLVQANRLIKRVEMFNMWGMPVLSQWFSPSKTVALNAACLPTGSYIVRITFFNQQHISKHIIKL